MSRRLPIMLALLLGGASGGTNALAQTSANAPAQDLEGWTARAPSSSRTTIRNLDAPPETPIRNLDSPTEMEKPAPPVRRRWYGAPILAIDGLAFTTAILGATSSGVRPMLGLGLAGYVFGGPAVHGEHGHTGKVLGSLGLRLAPFALIAGIAELAPCSPPPSLDGSNDACFQYEAFLLGLGVQMMLAASIVDATVIAREDDHRVYVVRVTPWMDPATRRIGAGIGGAF